MPNSTLYVDSVLDGAGMMQLALFNWTALGEEARVRYLTNGPFEVVGGVRGYDVETDLLFYLRTANNGIERVVESITRNGTITRWGAEHAGSFLDVQVSTV